MTATSLARRISRSARRAWFQVSSPQGPNAGAIEEQMAFSLFLRSAARLGLESHEIGRVLRLECRGKRFHVSGTATDLDTFPLGALAGDKVVLRSIFQEIGLPLPAGRSFSRDQARRAVAYGVSLGKACVVKPARDTSSGRGVSVDLRSAGQIRSAFAFAGLYSDEILVEEQAPGDSYRYLVFRGRCVSVIRRELAAVEGDGFATVRQLALRENAGRLQTPAWKEGDPGSLPIPLGKAAERVLRDQGRSWTSVPRQAEFVPLASLANFRSGGTFSEHIDTAHPGPMRVAERAAEALGLTLAGVDLMTTDPTQDRCHIIEINTTPSVPMHYFIRNPSAARDPIDMVLRDYFQIPQTGATEYARA